MSYAPTSSPWPQARPDTTSISHTSSSSSQSQSSHDDGPDLPASASSPPPSRPDNFPANSGSDSDSSHHVSNNLGTPELQNPKVRDFLREQETQPEEDETFADIVNDVLYGDDDPLDPRVDDLSVEERIELAFDQRIEAGTASTVIGMAAADVTGAITNMVPGSLKFPAQVLIGTTMSRGTFPPLKEAADWFHGEVLDQPIVDPAPGIFTEENALDFIPGVVSTGVGMGAKALTTTALTAIGVTNPVVLTIAGVGAGVYGAGKAWVWTDEVAIPAVQDYLQDQVAESIDIERLTGVPDSRGDVVNDPISIAELESLWDSVADQVPEDVASGLRPTVGALAPDSWTIGDIVRYETTGVMPEVDPELEEFLARNGIEPKAPELEVEEEMVDTAVLTSPRPPEPTFRSVRPELDQPIETITIVDRLPPEMVTEVKEDTAEPAVDRFTSWNDDDDDGPSPQCLVPFWLIPYVDDLAAMGVRNFCALKDLTPEDIEELLQEPDEVPDEPAETVTEMFGIPMFFSSRVDKTQVEEEDEEDDDMQSILLLV